MEVRRRDSLSALYVAWKPVSKHRATPRDDRRAQLHRDRTDATRRRCTETDRLVIGPEHLRKTLTWFTAMLVFDTWAKIVPSGFVRLEPTVLRFETTSPVDE